jgi:hypothetical protein
MGGEVIFQVLNLIISCVIMIEGLWNVIVTIGYMAANGSSPFFGFYSVLLI